MPRSVRRIGQGPRKRTTAPCQHRHDAVPPTLPSWGGKRSLPFYLPIPDAPLAATGARHPQTSKPTKTRPGRKQRELCHIACSRLRKKHVFRNDRISTAKDYSIPFPPPPQFYIMKNFHLTEKLDGVSYEHLRAHHDALRCAGFQSLLRHVISPFSHSSVDQSTFYWVGKTIFSAGFQHRDTGSSFFSFGPRPFPSRLHSALHGPARQARKSDPKAITDVTPRPYSLMALDRMPWTSK